MIKLKLESIWRVRGTFLRWRRQNLEDVIHASHTQLPVLVSSQLNVGLDLLDLTLDRRHLFKHLITINSGKRRAGHNVEQSGGLVGIRDNSVVYLLT